MYGTIGTALWLAFLLIVGRFAWKHVKEPVTAVLDEQRKKAELQNEGIRAKNQANQEVYRQQAADAALSGKLETENLDLKRAQLRQQTAEADAATKVAAATAEARAQEETVVIAARAEGRAIAARELAVNGPKAGSGIDAIAQAYAAYMEQGGRDTFSYWMGHLRVVGGDLVDMDG